MICDIFDNDDDDDFSWLKLWKSFNDFLVEQFSDRHLPQFWTTKISQNKKHQLFKIYVLLNRLVDWA